MKLSKITRCKQAVPLQKLQNSLMDLDQSASPSSRKKQSTLLTFYARAIRNTPPLLVHECEGFHTDMPTWLTLLAHDF